MSRRSVLIGLALFAGALAIRLWGLSFGLPYFFSGDEVEKTEVALYLADTSFDHWDGQPSFLFNSLYAIYAAARWVHPHLTNADYVYVGRLWMAMLGALTVVAVWRLGSRFDEPNERSGLLAAVILTVLPLHTACSRYIKEDAPLALAGTLAVLAAVAYLRRPSPRGLALMGLAAGAACSTKYTGLLFAAPVAAAWLVQVWRARSGVSAPLASAAGLAGAAALGFFLISPMFLRHPARILEGLRFQGTYSVVGHDGLAIDPWSEWWTYYLRTALVPGLTWPLVLLAAAGLVVLLKRSSGWLVGLTAVWLYLVLEHSPAKPAPFADRYLMPLVPLLAVGAGVALARVVSILRARMPASAAVALGLLVFVGPPLAKSAAIAAEASHDTRTIAGAWMDTHVPSGAQIVVAEGVLNLPASDHWFTRWSVDDRNRQVRPATEWSGDSTPYFVVSSFGADRFLDYPDAAPVYTQFFRTVLHDFQIVAQFQPRWLTYGKHSPVITIARPPQAGARAEPCRDCDARTPAPRDLPFGAIESPVAESIVGRRIHLRGWALGDGGVATVQSFVDGRFWRRLPLNEARGEVSRAFWLFSRGWDCHGWQLDAALPSNIGDGSHTLEIRVTDRRGAAREVGRVSFVVR